MEGEDVLVEISTPGSSAPTSVRNVVEISGYVRSRRRGNQRLLFFDINIKPLLEASEENKEMKMEKKEATKTTANVVNSKVDRYYKYKTSFTPSEADTYTLVFYSHDTLLNIESPEQQMSCDQFRKWMTVGSKITCTAYQDKVDFYKSNEKAIPSWLVSSGKQHYTSTLMKVMRIVSVESSRPLLSQPMSLLSNSNQENKDRGLLGVEGVHCNDKEHKKERTKLFVDWLIETYGRDFLCSGCGIVDIAGGKGAISWELQCIRGIPCTLIEPRTIHLSGRQKKFLRKKNVHTFKHYQMALRNPAQDQQVLVEKEMHSLFSNCSLIIGMHPDEATDIIVEYADYYDKPLAMVPCCVYAELFPHRRIPASCSTSSSSSVLTYEDLLHFLQFYKTEKPLAQINLPFQGRCKVLFRKA